MTRLRVGHASGRYDVSPWKMAVYFRALINDGDLDVLTTTETAGPSFRRATRNALGKGWRVQQQGEHLCITRRSRVKVIRRPRTVFTNAIRGLPGWMQMRPAVFHHRIDGTRVRTVVIHGPAGIESGDNWKATNARQVENAKSGWSRLGRNVRRFARRHPRAVQVIAYDCNLDQSRPRWLHYMEQTIGAPSIWRDHAPRGGTHGTRLIDGAQVLGARILGAQIASTPRPDGLDHRAVTFDLNLKEHR